MLLGRLGAHTHKIATSSPESQKFFDQGLTLLYGFNRYEALRSFRKAAELDPGAIKPLWGIAMALGPHINMDMDGDVNLKEGCDALSKAKALSQQSSAYEKAYLATAATRCPEYDPAQYTDAMRRLHQQYPDDLDAATLYAESLMIPARWKWWNADGSPAAGTALAVEFLEYVMRRDPEHPGANHLYIHAVEMSPSPERAIPSAQRLMAVVPDAGHLVHMPGHIWLILGDWETAADVNERAAKVDQDYFARTGVQSGYAGYYLHNLHFVAYARAMQGRAAGAIKAADLLARESAHAAETMPEMADSFVPHAIFTRVRFGRWDAVLSLPRPQPKLLASTALWHWARAIAWAAKGDRTISTREAELFRAARSKVPAVWPWLNNKAADVLALAGEALNARMAPNGAAAVEHWSRAVELQDKLNYDEPPAWYMPLRESLGAALLRAGDAALAEAVFREGLRRSPRNGRVLFGLMKALEAQQKTEAAEFVRREFDREWKSAQAPLRLEDL
jgi:tetratricopeptide (TPR) repeat protein